MVHLIFNPFNRRTFCAVFMNLDALTTEILDRCDALARCSDEQGRITRTFLSPATHDAHRLVCEWMAAAGLTLRIDAVGNIIGRHRAQNSDAGVFVVGSHIDTVPNAGKYDGVLGVMLAIAAAQVLTQRQLRHHLDVIAFSEEEGVRFGVPYLGSRAVAGSLAPELLERRDKEGASVVEAILEFGLDPNAIPSAAYADGDVIGYLEAHIEQGPVFDSIDVPLGVVTAIIGQERYWLRFIGQSGHAGAQPMELRRDALAGACEFVGCVEGRAKAVPGLRATVGWLDVASPAANVVPGDVCLTLDIRHEDDLVLHEASDVLLGQAAVVAHRRQLRFEFESMMNAPSVAMNAGMTGRLSAAVGPAAHRLVSGAGHDAAIMAEVCPSCMLFVRSPGGISHHPDETVRRDDVQAALAVMIRFLSQELGGGD